MPRDAYKAESKRDEWNLLGIDREHPRCPWVFCPVRLGMRLPPEASAPGKPRRAFRALT